ncbi:MAG TPA: tRNA 2-thiouridine(34) synthase MnmA [Dehalococcoidia bacterium]|nr:tRNA 2-thiouridine(34) synthase MnmA [Dehalococcoidia bacterium]
MTKERVAVALSGGVDSAVAAYLLQKKGYEVIGMHMILQIPREASLQGAHSEGIQQIQRFCDDLGIGFYAVDLCSEFKKKVVDSFIEDYKAGLTPNPCIRCNYYIKFGSLLRRAAELKAGHMATGHYARLSLADGAYRIMRGKDMLKDQSYMLCRLSQQQLAHALFPLGEYTKEEVIRIALHEGFAAAHRRSSQDICFIRGRYNAFLYRHLGPVPGNIRDKYGNILGSHAGIYNFTIGQRYGTGLAAGKRLYVTQIDSGSNTITVGDMEDIYHHALIAVDVNWVAGVPPASGGGIKAQIRYKSAAAEAVLKLEQDHIHVQFSTPQKAITPGQSIAFYSDDELLGGGMIQSYAQ